MVLTETRARNNAMTLEEKIEAIRAVLKDLKAGVVTAMHDIPEGTSVAQSWGDIVFTLSNGWKMTVFNDCGGWDYVDSFQMPDGTTIASDELYSQDEDGVFLYPDIIFYRPPDDVIENVYKWKLL